MLGFLASVTLNKRVETSTANDQASLRSGNKNSGQSTRSPTGATAGSTVRLASGQKPQAADAGSTTGSSGKKTIVDSLTSALNSWESFAKSLEKVRAAGVTSRQFASFTLTFTRSRDSTRVLHQQKLKNDSLVDNALRNAMTHVLRYPADKLVMITDQLRNAVVGAENVDSQLRVLQPANVQLVIDFAANCSGALDALAALVANACTSSPSSADCRVRAAVSATNNSVGPLLAAASVLRRFNSQVALGDYFSTRLRDAVRMPLLNSSLNASLDEAFANVREELRSALRKLSSAVGSPLAGVSASLEEARKQLASSSSSVMVSTAESARYVALRTCTCTCALTFSAVD